MNDSDRGIVDMVRRQNGYFDEAVSRDGTAGQLNGRRDDELLSALRTATARLQVQVTILERHLARMRAMRGR